MLNLSRLFCFALAAVVCCQPANTVLAQAPIDDAPPVKMSARYHIEDGTNAGFLIVRVEIPKGNHIYGLNQPKPLRKSEIMVEQSQQFTSEKKFKSDKKPKVIDRDPLFEVRVEKFQGSVQFYVPVKIAAGSDPAKILPKVAFTGQVCSEDGYCTSVDKLTVKAKFKGYFQREAKVPVPPLK